MILSLCRKNCYNGHHSKVQNNWGLTKKKAYKKKLFKHSNSGLEWTIVGCENPRIDRIPWIPWYLMNILRDTFTLSLPLTNSPTSPHPHHDKTTNTYILLLGSTLYANQIYIGFYKGTSDQWDINLRCRLMFPVKQFIQTAMIAMSFPLWLGTLAANPLNLLMTLQSWLLP